MMNIKQWLQLLTLLALSALVAACQSAGVETPPGGAGEPAETPIPSAEGGDNTGGQAELPQGVQLARSDVQRDATPTVDPTDLGALESGNTQFAFDLYHAVLPTVGSDNLIYSPYSISIAFAMVYAGARGQTEEEIASTLNYTLPQDRLHPAFNALDLELTTQQRPEAQEEGELTLRIANSLWGQSGFDFEQAFLDTLAANYGAGMRLVDFAQSEPARQAINQWVEDQTEDRIQDLIPDGVLNQDTRLVLANAIYFYGGWRFPFQQGATQDLPFTLIDGAQVTVPMMSLGYTDFLYASGDGYQAVDLPYGPSESAAMLVILPEAGRFAEIESALDAAKFDEIRGSLHNATVTQLLMPRFDFATTLSLEDALKSMGMVAPFDNADFTGISTQAPLAITAVLHKANITVDEEGTEAAAATAIIVGETAAMPVDEQVEVRLDHPFIFAIYDRVTGTVLFLGRVMNPVQ